jgi:hypothetical protein
MEYNKIIAVSGLPGLYELLSSKSDGAIVRSLDDKTTRFVSSRVHNFSHLESIEVYTVRDNVNLVDVLNAMEASTEKLPDDKDNAALKAYFGKVYPDLDLDRVYSSDLKKMVKWFNVLRSNNIEIKLSQPEEGVEDAATTADEENKAEAPAPATKKTAKEKAAAAEEEKEPAKAKAPAAKKTAKETAAEKPAAKKAASKEEGAEKPEVEESKENSQKKQPGKTASPSPSPSPKKTAKETAKETAEKKKN